MIASGYKMGALRFTIERDQIEIGQLGYDIDTLVIDGIAYDVTPVTNEVPLTDVDTSTSNFIAAEEMAAKFLNGLKGQVVVYLKAKLGDAEAVAAGVDFVAPRSVNPNGVGSEYDYFIKAGGHPAAASALYARIQSVKSSFAWFDDNVNAIFTAALTRSQ